MDNSVNNILAEIEANLERIDEQNKSKGKEVNLNLITHEQLEKTLKQFVEAQSDQVMVLKETTQQLEDLGKVIKDLEFQIPEIKVPEANITIPAPIVNVSPSPVTFPKEFDIKKPSWINNLFPIEAILNPLSESIKQLQSTFANFVLPRDAKDPISVRLSDGSSFYKSIMQMVGSVGAGLAVFQDISGNNSLAKLSSDKYVVVAQSDEVIVNGQTVKLSHVALTASNSGQTAVIAAVTGKQIRIISGLLMAAATVTVKFQSNNTDLTGSMPVGANAGFQMPFLGGAGNFDTAVGEALNINLGGAVAVGGWLKYILI